jgi:predicted ATPase
VKIEEIKLTNFRSYRELVPIYGISDVNAFVGPNGAGKSNILEALKFLRGLEQGSLTRPFNEMAFDRNPESEIQLSLRITLSDFERDRILKSLFSGKTGAKLDNIRSTPFLKCLTYSVTLVQNGIESETIQTPNLKTDDLTLMKRWRSQPNQIKRESVDLDTKCSGLSQLENVGTGLRDRDTEHINFQLLQYDRLPPSEMMIIGMLREYIRSWEWFDPIRQVTARMESGEENSLNSQGLNLTKYMNSILSITPRRFVSLADEVIKILPAVEEILAPLRERMATLTVKERGLSTPTEVSNVSFGFMQILILVVGIATKKDGSLIMIEEPELHLHATAQRRLFELIREMAKRKQFFLTTHSTIFTGCDDRTNTYLVTKQEGATGISKIETTKELRITKDILGHRNIDFFGDECVVFIEGDSEETAFPIIAQSLGYDLCRKGIRLVNVKGVGKATKIGEYLRYLKDSGVTSYVIADGNKKVKELLQDWERAGTINQGNWTVWSLEFEDCFDDSMISHAFNDMMKDQNIKLEITTDQLKERKEGVSVVKTLEKVLHEKGHSLDKPELAERLATHLSQDLAKEGHKETPPETEIRKIVRLVDEKR